MSACDVQRDGSDFAHVIQFCAVQVFGSARRTGEVITILHLRLFRDSSLSLRGTFHSSYCCHCTLYRLLAASRRVQMVGTHPAAVGNSWVDFLGVEEAEDAKSRIVDSVR